MNISLFSTKPMLAMLALGTAGTLYAAIGPYESPAIRPARHDLERQTLHLLEFAQAENVNKRGFDQNDKQPTKIDERAQSYAYDWELVTEPDAISVELPIPTRADHNFVVSVHFELPVSCYDVTVVSVEEASFIHYLDYTVEQNDDECSAHSTLKTVELDLGVLPAGRHTISTFAPDGTEMRTMFQILPGRL